MVVVALETMFSLFAYQTPHPLSVTGGSFLRTLFDRLGLL